MKRFFIGAAFALVAMPSTAGLFGESITECHAKVDQWQAAQLRRIEAINAGADAKRADIEKRSKARMKNKDDFDVDAVLERARLDYKTSEEIKEVEQQLATYVMRLKACERSR